MARNARMSVGRWPAEASLVKYEGSRPGVRQWGVMRTVVSWNVGPGLMAIIF